MQKDSLQRGLTVLDEASARQRYLCKGSGRSRSANGKGFPPLLHRYEPWQDRRELETLLSSFLPASRVSQKLCLVYTESAADYLRISRVSAIVISLK
jgi:hypothetical protein